MSMLESQIADQSIALITSAMTLFGVLFTAVMAYKKIDKVQKTGEAVHVLVNSNMGIQLKISAIALRRIADITKEKSDIRAYKIAEQALIDHDARQAVVDGIKA